MAAPACPKCNGSMALKSGSRGPFYSCTAYPKCKGTRDVLPAAVTDAPASAPRAMASKFAGKCSRCGNAFAAGASILYSKTAGGVVGCPSCPSAAVLAAGPVTEAPVVLGVPAGATALTGIPARSLMLDEHQEAVVGWRDGEAIVAAAAGSGKSTVLVERLAALLAEGVMPEATLTLVFNRSAADSLRERLAARLGGVGADRVTAQAQTFHAYCFQVLKAWNPGSPRYRTDRIIGLPDGPRAPAIAGRVMKSLRLDGEWKTFVGAAERIREAMIDLDAPDAIADVAELVAGGSLRTAETLVDFARGYQAAKEEENAIDFADMLHGVASEIRDGTSRAQALGKLYTHVQVDEGQDINPARLVLAEHIGKGARSLVMVGDLRQSVYGFTGARPDLFKGRLDAGAKLLTLPVNRRSTGAVVTAGNKIADGRDWNLGGACSPAPGKPDGEPVQAWRTKTAVEEAAQVAAEIKARVAGGLALADAKGQANYVCLTRTNAQAVQLEAGLLAAGLPVRVLGGKGGVWSTSIGREVLAYLRAANGRADDDLARVANKPLRYLKRATVESAVAQSNSTGKSIADVLRYWGDDSMQRRACYQLANDLNRLAGFEWEERCDEIAEMLIRDLHDRAAEAEERVGAQVSPDEDREAAYKALAEAAATAGSVKAIDDQIAAVEHVEDGPAVEISTCHRAKGAEWAVVFTCGVTEGSFPHKKSLDIEEERRLFYVAVTRAKEVAIISVGGLTPSQFILDAGLLPPNPTGDDDKPKPKLSPEERAAALARAAEQVGAVDDAIADTVRYHLASLAPEMTDPVADVPERELDTAAEVLTSIQAAGPHAAEMRGTDARAGERYVIVTVVDMADMMDRLGFARADDVVEEKAGQQVFERELAGQENSDGHFVIRVYSTVPVNGSAARELGEDSIKVAGLWIDESGEARPMHSKLPYACRTTGWRETLLERVEAIVGKLAFCEYCPDCGAPFAERDGKNGPFLGCTRYPDCRQTKQL